MKKAISIISLYAFWFCHCGAQNIKQSFRENPAYAPVNVIFLLTDDQRNDTVGCSGHPIIQTPVIDRLAAEGVRFENAFVKEMVALLEKLVADGRSTPGASQKNDAQVDIWKLKSINVDPSALDDYK